MQKTMHLNLFQIILTIIKIINIDNSHKKRPTLSAFFVCGLKWDEEISL